MSGRSQPPRDSLLRLIDQVDNEPTGVTPADTVPTGFLSLDRALGGGLRQRDLTVLGGDVGSGKSALALAIAVRAASLGHPVTYLSGEMDTDRLMERALSMEGKAVLSDLRLATLSDEKRSSVGAAAVRLRDIPLVVQPMVGRQFDDVIDPAWQTEPSLVIVDYLQLLPPPTAKLVLAEDEAAAVKALKAIALERRVACLLIAQLPDFTPERPDPRPTLEDFGATGAVKQHADTILSLYREEMYRPGGGVDGAAELLISKNRNGATGSIDLYFYKKWLRFEDMLDPD